MLCNFSPRCEPWAAVGGEKKLRWRSAGCGAVVREVTCAALRVVFKIRGLRGFKKVLAELYLALSRVILRIVLILIELN